MSDLVRGLALVLVGVFGLFGGRDKKDDCPDCHRPAPSIEHRQQRHLQMPAGPQSTQREVDACFAEVNRFRAQHGKAPLSIDPVLTKIARERVRYYDHFPRQYGAVWTHAARAGFCRADIRYCTDNLGQGRGVGGAEMARGWAAKPSVGHREQLLGYCKFNGRWVNAGYNCCGIAKSGQNWIIVLGRKP